MIALSVRLLKRLFILAVGAGLVYVAIWHVFPFFDHRLPWFAALLITYIFMAYVLIPALFRGARFFFRPAHIPLYCLTPDGFASDPINIGLVGSRGQIIRAMQKAGWELADKHTPTNVAREVVYILLRRPYPTAPMSNLYLFGRKHDLGFEVQIDGARGHRHHVRFWACNVEAPEAFSRAISFWRRFYRPDRKAGGRQLWVGAATKDVGFAPIRYNAQLTHMIDPDTNAERDFIVQGLSKSKQLSRTRVIVLDKPYQLTNRAWRGYLATDGRITICELKDQR